jgi:hypothetical protein
MLRRLANSVLRWGLAGILAATSLLGGHLHEILGIHHAGHFGGRGCEGGGLAGQHAAAVAAGSAESCDDEANCPICNYLAQGRIVGERFEGFAVTANVPNPSPAIPLCLPTTHLQPFQARAPPAA